MALPLLLAACGGGGSDNPTPANPAPPTVPAVTLSATAATGQLLVGGATTLSATVSDNSAVTWQLPAGAPGKLSATTGASVTYTAPASGIAVPTAVNVTATAAGISKTVQLVVNPEPGSAGLSLIAGSLGSHALVDGDAATARFWSITDVEPAANGSWYVVDKYATALRRVTAKGTVSTIVDAGGDFVSAPKFLAVAADTDGGAWAVQRLNDVPVLRKVAANGTVATVGTPKAELNGTIRLVAGGPGELFALVSSAEFSGIVRVTTTGVVTPVAGGTGGGLPADGLGTSARFSNPTDMTRMANGDLYVIDGRFVRQVTPAGRVTTVTLTDASTGANLPEEASLHSIAARSDGTLALLMRTQDRYRICIMNAGGAWITQYSGPRIPADQADRGMTEFDLVRMGTDGTLLVSNRGELHTQHDFDLTPLAGLEDDSLADIDSTGAAARFVSPRHIASDQRGNIYVNDHPVRLADTPFAPSDYGLYLRRIDSAGKVTTLVTDAKFGRMFGLLADQNGNVYVLERARWQSRITTLGGAIYKVSPGGALTLVAGQTDAQGPLHVDGKGAQARFSQPRFAGIAPDGTLYVYDYDTSQTIRKITPDGTVTTVAALPADVGLAPDGKRYDFDGETVGRIEADGSRTIVAGQKGRDGTVLGALPGALGVSGGGASPGRLTPTGLHTFALVSHGAIVKLVVPH